MTPPFDLAKLRARAAVFLHDPQAPTNDPQEHQVRLFPIECADQLHARWQAPQAWCREKVQQQSIMKIGKKYNEST
jgi:hypothetical protein